jgi:hypothetical protein
VTPRKTGWDESKPDVSTKRERAESAHGRVDTSILKRSPSVGGKSLADAKKAISFVKGDTTKRPAVPGKQRIFTFKPDGPNSAWQPPRGHVHDGKKAGPVANASLPKKHTGRLEALKKKK